MNWSFDITLCEMMCFLFVCFLVSAHPCAQRFLSTELLFVMSNGMWKTEKKVFN